VPALDAAAYRGPWRYRHPGEKVLLSLGLLVCAVALPPWPGAPLTAAIALAVLLGPARLPAGAVARAVRAPLAFVAVGMLPLLVTVGPDAGAGGAGTGVGWAPDGPAAAAGLGARSAAALLCLVLVAATTPLADVLPRLARIGVPEPVVEVAALVYRMLFGLLATAAAVREAQAGRLGYATVRAGYRSLAGQAAAVFVLSLDRARRLEQGLALRSTTGSLRVLVEERPVSVPFLAGTCAVLALDVALTLALRAAPW